MAQPPSFMTEAPHAHHADYEALAKQLSVEYEHTMEAPRENCRKLMDVAAQLNDKMKALLEKERQEFVAAYRAHTKKIQEDLARLRARVAEEQESLHRDEKVKRLSRERDDYRAQALALDAGNAALSASLEATRAKLEVLEDDRNFVVRALRKAAAVARKAADNDRPSGDHRGGGGVSGLSLSADGGSVGSMDTAALLRSLQAAVEDHEPLFLPPINGASGERSPRALLASGGESGDDAAVVEALRSEQKQLERAGRSERKALEAATREVQLVQRRREGNWLEALLLECVKGAGDVVAHRRGTAEARGGAGSAGCEGGRALAVDVWGEAPLRLETFTAADRTSALRRLLADPRVSSAVGRKQADLAAARQHGGEQPRGLSAGDGAGSMAGPIVSPPAEDPAAVDSPPRAPAIAGSAPKPARAGSLAVPPPKVSRLGPLGGYR